MRLLLSILMLSLLGCCGKSDKCNSIVETSPGPKRFFELFPNATCKIKRFGGFGSPLSWKAREIVYDRYEICCYIDRVETVSKTEQNGNCVVYINEVISDIELDTNGKWISISRTTLGQLSVDRFMMISSVDELFMALDIKPKKDMPISNIGLLRTHW